MGENEESVTEEERAIERNIDAFSSHTREGCRDGRLVGWHVGCPEG